MLNDDIGKPANPAAGQPQVSAGQPAMANPAAWAVTAFATTSFMLGMYNTRLLNPAGAGIVIPAAFFFGGLVQIIVAIMEISRATCSARWCSAPTGRSG
jgi:succinate-acetate transporter protein